MKLKNPELFQQANYWNGQWRQSSTGEVIEVDNPSTGKIIGQVPSVNRAEVADAIDVAERAFQSWRQEPAHTRAKVLRKWGDLLLTHVDDLAEILTTEQGKPLAEAKGEVRYAASYLHWFAEEAPRNYGDTIPAPKTSQKIIVQKQPVGVCGCITPWNFPIAMLARKVAAALAAGCTVVAKPAEATPFSALALAYLGECAGVPGGVFNIVTGDSAMIGDEFTENPKIRKISFTGSTRVGRLLQEKSGRNLIKLSLELGGNAPLIVFDDADLDLAVKGTIAAKFRNAGQTCVCVNRLFVQRSIYDEFIKKLKVAVEALVVGDGHDEGVTIGPLIHQKAVEKFQKHFDDAVAQGARVICGDGKANGNFVKPVLMTDGKPSMMFCQEETFAPLLVAVPFDTEEEAIQLANDTPYGLASYFYSNNISRVMRVTDALESGMVGVNETAISNATAPFGGVKWSGYGREGSKYGMDEYLQVKYVLLGG
ncbi:NAD-dependent succinate-semialdehyde dehydrogenase [Saccharophagus sp. K07]|jgi:succinate-semialdehyde dehydrogenase/glutarate-semialdehyde dehydrogenase|uniref:NAD-dependent succinate-semialdehyde dehydrogenase n=1 Tax=Saccharophagus sp. K07 TaxID=2283636 RepID=UPI001652AC2E|nr:NAD-dependent succinate-semialdehyde dehydrogenase [Saccharophagus sp. K07]MBC6904494.1 NAD-dependent succinate-semialdehyde dehydrogenase [Saccharophagus sp. K07]